MSLHLRCILLAACLSPFACGPSAGGDDDGATTPGEGSSVGEASTTSPVSTGMDATTADVSTSGSSTTVATDESSSGTTGPTEEPVGCYESSDPEDSECCPELAQPCPVVMHDCLDRFDCSEAPFAGPVQDPMAAQCMLAALAQGSSARLDQRVEYDFGGTEHQWLVSASGEVTLVRADLQDFSFQVWFMRCQLADAATLESCATEEDPQVLSDCLTAALEACEETTEPLCPA